MIAILQICGFIFALTMVYFALLHYRKKTLSLNEFSVWTLIWIIVIFVVSFPDLFRAFAQDVLLARLFDLMVIGGFVLIMVIVSVAYIKSNRNQKKLEELVRELSFKNEKKGK